MLFLKFIYPPFLDSIPVSLPLHDDFKALRHYGMELYHPDAGDASSSASDLGLLDARVRNTLSVMTWIIPSCYWRDRRDIRCCHGSHSRNRERNSSAATEKT